MSKQEQLNKIKAEILEQNICPELAEGATQLVFGDGSPGAELVFIGEAPGKSEDKQGLPFVGAAGKFLNEMLAGIGLQRSDVYITNIVKYRPPGNRDPSSSEKAEFLPFLQSQLEVIRPKLVVTLGRHSMECFLPGLQISNVHGQPKRIKIVSGGPGTDAVQGAGGQRTEMYKKHSTSKEQPQPATPQRAASDSGAAGSAGRQAVTSWVILPLFHPAAALYNGGMRQTIIDDFSRIPKILEQIKEAPRGKMEVSAPVVKVSDKAPTKPKVTQKTIFDGLL